MGRPDLPGELWRPIVGYEGQYEVSTLGRVWSVERAVSNGKSARKAGGMLLSPLKSRRGYLVVTLPPAKTRNVHRLVSEAFIGPRPPGMKTRHLDGNILNCSLANLEYGTGKQNKLDQVEHGTHANANQTHCPANHEYTEANTYRWRGKRYCRACRAKRKR